MRCEEVKELLEAYVESELDESQLKAVQAHISSCESCKQELALTQAIPRLVSSLQTPPVPEDIIPNALRIINETPTTQWEWLRSFGAFLSGKWRFAAIACSLIIISLFSISYYREYRQPKITDAEVELAVKDLKLALGLVGTATQDVQTTAMTAGSRALNATKSKSKSTMRTLSGAQSEVSDKLRFGLAVLAQLQKGEVDGN